MQIYRMVKCLIVILVFALLPACGGGASDTSGALTMTTPTSTSNGDGTYSVSTTVTYEPPAGKSAQGVEITMVANDFFGVVRTNKIILTSGSNSSTITYPRVTQLVGSTNYLSIISSIGDMKASVGTVIPAITQLSASPIDFIAGEAASPGTTKTTTISGGVGTYSLISPSTVDGVLTVSLAGSTLSVKYISTTTAAFIQTFITIGDVTGSTLLIPVSYYK